MCDVCEQKLLSLMLDIFSSLYLVNRLLKANKQARLGKMIK